MTLYDYICSLSVYDMAEFLSNFIHENTHCPDPYEIREWLSRPYKQEEEE